MPLRFKKNQFFAHYFKAAWNCSAIWLRLSSQFPSSGSSKRHLSTDFLGHKLRAFCRKLSGCIFEFLALSLNKLSIAIADSAMPVAANAISAGRRMPKADFWPDTGLLSHPWKQCASVATAEGFLANLPAPKQITRRIFIFPRAGRSAPSVIRPLSFMATVANSPLV
jgi:hypothetical protein